MADARSPAPPPAQRTLLSWSLVIAFAAMGWMQTSSLLAFQPLGVDFLPLWTASRLGAAHAYDVRLVTDQQAWLMGHLVWARPFVNPPTTLLVLAPLSALPFWPALWAWNGAGLAALLAATAKLAGHGRAAALALGALAPPVVLALLVGQSVLLTAGLAALAIAWLEPRPRLAGALIAVAAAIKPQALLVAPVALVACGAWEAFASAAVCGLALAALSVLVFGWQRWAEWLSILPAFQAEIAAAPGMMRGVIAPTELAREFGLSGAAVLALRMLCGLAGALLTWNVFRRSADPALRAAAVLCGGLLASPYALHYDASVLIPAAAARAAADAPESRAWLTRLLALLAAALAVRPYLGAPLLVAFAALTLIEIVPTPPVGRRS